MYIKIDIEPVACPRPKVTRYATFYPKRYTQWRERMLIKLSPLPMIEEELLEIDLKFIMKRPKSKHRRKDLDQRYPHTKKPDIDNLIKGVFDALQKASVIREDSLIWRVSAQKEVASKSESPSIIIHIKRGGTSDNPSSSHITKQSKQTSRGIY